MTGGEITHVADLDGHRAAAFGSVIARCPSARATRLRKGKISKDPRL